MCGVAALSQVQMLRTRLKAMSYSTKGQDPRGLFAHFDRDNNGQLSLEEFHNAIRKGGGEYNCS